MPRTPIDGATGLPERAVHEASGITLRLLPAGEFTMGSATDDSQRDKEERQHRRRISAPFYLAETEVTVGQWAAYAEATGYETDAERGVDDGGHGRGAFSTVAAGDRDWSDTACWRAPFTFLQDYRQLDDHPVVQVSWNDAMAFAAHYGLTLPSEAQWEYAARAGSSAAYPWGDDPEGAAGFGNVKDDAGRRRFSGWNTSFALDDGFELLAPVASFQPNAWGLFDMTGNVTEWCLDNWAAYPPDGTDERPALDGSTSRIMRGGSWLDDQKYQRPAQRLGFGQQSRRDFIGFRVALALPD